ncbi:MAG TPA: hypothetical protein VF010_02475, partial [Methylomirabilota bacterium]|nr:hypothetical protein [Methylomirabilota bacterium]
MARLRDLELTIQSRYPFVAVETSEEDRLEKGLLDIAEDLQVPFFVWTVTSGLRRAGLPNAMYDTQQPLRALNTVAAMAGEAMFLMKDLQRFFGEPAVVRKLLDLAPEFKHDRRVIVFSAVKIELPGELGPLTALHTLALPAPDELKRIVKQAIVACERDGPVTVRLPDADLDRLVERLRGFTAFEAERAVTRAIVQDRTLDAGDIDTII